MNEQDNNVISNRIMEGLYCLLCTPFYVLYRYRVQISAAIILALWISATWFYIFYIMTLNLV